MAAFKKILQSDFVQVPACWLAAQYVNLVTATGNWTMVRGEIPEAYWREGKPFILALWHGRLLMQTKCWRSDRKFHMLISSHRDGRLIARTIGHLGLESVAGSTKKGGAQAFRAMVKILKSGEYVGITPDGPRGPRMRATMGVVNLAKLSGVPIIPVSCSASRRKLMGSWDRFMVAKLFSKGVFTWGEPIEVPRDASKEDLETLRQTVEDTLTALTNEADGLCGQPTVAADPIVEEAAA
jgi:lysophospholipid acyltransferase (LPLAT)-like uncharacterized protein